jgi:hypothetical protein
MRIAIHTCFLFPAVLLPLTLSAQAPTLDARSFVPAEPKVEVWADLAAMRESGVWDGIASSLGALLLKPAEQELGFSLEAVDRIRCYPPVRDDKGPGSHSGLVIVEGNDQVVVPADRPKTGTASVGVHELLVDERFGGDDPDVWFAPKKGVLVSGPKSRIEPVLLGQQLPGVLPPELLSLTSSRGALAHTVGVLEAGTSGVELLQMLEAPAGMPPPRYLIARLRQEQVEGQDEPSIVVEATARWHDDDKTPALLAAHVRTRIEVLGRHKRFGAWKRYLQKIEVVADARDLEARLVLGRPKDAGAMFAAIVPMLLVSGSRVEAVEVEAAAEPPPPPPVPVPQPAGGGQGRGGG